MPASQWIPFFAAAVRRERQTGLLFPKLSHSSFGGFGVETPFFWAISDSQDLTISPFVFERRGAGLNADYRYFLSATNTGEMRGFYLREGSRDDQQRGWGHVYHDWK